MLSRARKENIQLSTLFKQRYNVNVLSAARFFLFGRYEPVANRTVVQQRQKPLV